MDNPERVTYFAATDSRGKRIPFGIKQKDRARHMYVIGKTGMGKSTLLENMAIQDIQNGEGIAFIDPHGGTADKLLEYIPESRIKDVVYFAPFDLDMPLAFNVMEDVGYDKRHLVVSGLMSTFKKVWVDAWSARMEYILSNTLLALLEYPGATLLGVNRMYTDKTYRKQVVDNVKDPVVKDFWVKEFAAYTDRYTQEATPSIQNKIGQFTSNPLIRNIIGQPKSSFDIRTMMDEKKIIIINLSKGLVGEVNMRLLGSMLTTRIFLAAMSRADASAQDLAKLPNFFFYVDEFQNFANDTFSGILSEARKYKLNLVIAHQYIEQMDEEVRPAVFGNVGTTIVFRVGPFDAEVLETIFMPEFTKEDLVNLGLRQIYLSLMIDDIGSRPFSAVTIPPIQAPPRTYKTEVIEASRNQFGTPRAGIEETLMAEFAATMQSEPEAADAKPRKKPAYPREPSRDSTEPMRAPRRDAPLREELPPRDTRPAYADSGRGTPPPRREEQPRMSAAPLPQERNYEQRREPPPARAYAEQRPPERRPDRPAMDRPAPHAAGKSAEDLKAILKNVAKNAGAERQVKVTEKQESLKSTLADILKRSSSPAEVVSAPPPAERRDVSTRITQTVISTGSDIPRERAPMPQSAPRDGKPVDSRPPMTRPAPRDIPMQTERQATASAPFEVPEETLRKILNGET